MQAGWVGLWGAVFRGVLYLRSVSFLGQGSILGLGLYLRLGLILWPISGYVNISVSVACMLEGLRFALELLRVCLYASPRASPH
jgi:hypothetical protein